MTYSTKTMEFLTELVAAAGWELRFSPQGYPYAALPLGFGNSEQGVKLHFLPAGGSVRVMGYIDYADKIAFQRPSLFVSIYSDARQSAQLIQKRLIPRYKMAWYKAQPLIAKWLEENPPAEPTI